MEHVQISVFKAGLEAATLERYDHPRRLRKKLHTNGGHFVIQDFHFIRKPLVASPTIKVFHALLLQLSANAVSMDQVLQHQHMYTNCCYRHVSCALHRYMKCSKLESQQYHLFRPQNMMWPWPYQLYGWCQPLIYNMVMVVPAIWVVLALKIW